MAVEVTIHKPGSTSTQTVTHADGKAWHLREGGILSIFSDEQSTNSGYLVATYAHGQWLSVAKKGDG